MGADRFRFRRVLIVVVAGLAALSLAFYGWVQYRQSQYNHRERALLIRYHDNYTLCLKVGPGDLACARHVFAACADDRFWDVTQPFATADTPPPDPLGQCRTVLTAS